MYEGNFLLLGHGMAVVKVQLDGTKRKPTAPVSLRSSQTATGLDTDCLRGKVWDNNLLYFP